MIYVKRHRGRRDTDRIKCTHTDKETNTPHRQTDQQDTDKRSDRQTNRTLINTPTDMPTGTLTSTRTGRRQVCTLKGKQTDRSYYVFKVYPWKRGKGHILEVVFAEGRTTPEVYVHLEAL